MPLPPKNATLRVLLWSLSNPDFKSQLRCYLFYEVPPGPTLDTPSLIHPERMTPSLGAPTAHGPAAHLLSLCSLGICCLLYSPGSSPRPGQNLYVLGPSRGLGSLEGFRTSLQKEQKMREGRNRKTESWERWTQGYREKH